MELADPAAEDRRDLVRLSDGSIGVDEPLAELVEGSAAMKHEIVAEFGLSEEQPMPTAGLFSFGCGEERREAREPLLAAGDEVMRGERDRRTGRRHQRPRHERLLFAAIDKPASKPLPGEPNAFAIWKRSRVAPDYRIRSTAAGIRRPAAREKPFTRDRRRLDQAPKESQSVVRQRSKLEYEPKGEARLLTSH
jgi:hypothetical protein